MWSLVGGMPLRVLFREVSHVKHEKSIEWCIAGLLLQVCREAKRVSSVPMQPSTRP
jgi:hypothetical protein